MSESTYYRASKFWNGFKIKGRLWRQKFWKLEFALLTKYELCFIDCLIVHLYFLCVCCILWHCAQYSFLVLGCIIHFLCVLHVIKLRKESGRKWKITTPLHKLGTMWTPYFTMLRLFACGGLEDSTQTIELVIPISQNLNKY